MKQTFLTVLGFLQAFLTVYSPYQAEHMDLHTLFGHFSKEKSAFLV